MTVEPRAGQGLTVADLEVRYEGSSSPAVRGVTFDVPRGELFMLLGPSGCGKSTVLRAIAGLVRPTTGRVALGESVLTDVASDIHIPPQHRHVGLVFQSYALWPHLTVAGNVAFPLEARGQGGRTRDDLVETALSRVGMETLAARPISSLSGGQQQRVALARAMVSNPPVLLLDEPLSNLDAELRRQMRGEIRDMQRGVGAAMVHVTHDREEAMEMGDRIAVMKDGRVLEVGSPKQLYGSPLYSWTASFLGDGDPVPYSGFRGTGPGSGVVDSPIGPIVSRRTGEEAPVAGGVLIRPEYVRWVSPDDLPVTNVYQGRVLSLRFLGTRTEYHVQIGEGSIRASGVGPTVEVGAQVQLHLPPEHCVLVRNESD